MPRGSGAGGSETLDTKLLASKLFAYLVSHAENCRLAIGRVAERLGEFSGGKSYDSKKALELVNSSRDKFSVIKNVEGTEQFVEVKTSVKICDAFQEGKCGTEGCKGLHICRFFLEGMLLTFILNIATQYCVRHVVRYAISVTHYI